MRFILVLLTIIALFTIVNATLEIKSAMEETTPGSSKFFCLSCKLPHYMECGCGDQFK